MVGCFVIVVRFVWSVLVGDVVELILKFLRFRY